MFSTDKKRECVDLDDRFVRFAQSIAIDKKAEQQLFHQFSYLRQELERNLCYLKRVRLFGGLATNTMLSEQHYVDLEVMLDNQMIDITPYVLLRKMQIDLQRSILNVLFV